MQTAVIGLGKIGLPLAAQFADAGQTVVGVDIDPRVVETVNAGSVPFPGEAHLDEYVSRLVPLGALRATTDYSDAVPQSDTIVVVVPLFVDGEGQPDFTWMDQATTDIALNLDPGRETLVIYETTLPVGTSRTRWRPMLEKLSGLTEGRHFHIVFSPERVLTGRVFQDLRRYPKLIGGLSDAGAARGRAFYEDALVFDERPDLPRGNGVWDLGSAEAAEMAKLAETTYRDVNIGLANQFAIFSERAGIDVYEVIEASNSQPYSHIHRPGISVGGHCIPVYPRLYLSNDPEATIVRAARMANANMPRHTVEVLSAHMGGIEGLRVVVLGLAYREGVKESAFTGTFDTVQQLELAGANVTVHDPLYADDELTRLGFRPHAMGEHVDAAILHTAHSEYSALEPSDFQGARTILDGRNFLRLDQVPGSATLIHLGRPQA